MYYLGAKLPEFFHSVIKCQNFSGTHKSEVQWVEEKHEIFSAVVAQFDLGEVSVDDGGAREVRGRFGDHGLGDLDVVAARPGPRVAAALVAGLSREAQRDQGGQIDAGGDHVCNCGKIFHSREKYLKYLMSGSHVSHCFII